MMSILITGFNRNVGFVVGHAWKAESNFPQKLKRKMIRLIKFFSLSIL